MRKFMRKDQNGFTLIEVLVAIAILGIIMVMNAQLMQDLIRGSSRQNAIVTTQFETALGLELMRTDIENAGFGLADDISGISYIEVDATETPAFQYNDATANVPRALVHSNNGSTGAPAAQNYIANSDYLVIKSPAVGENAAAKKWTYITTTAIHEWDTVNINNDLDMEAGDHMIVINPRTAPREASRLIRNVSSPDPFSVHFTRVYASLDGAFHPIATGERYLAYGVNRNGATELRMPFNRADYFVRRRTTSNDNPNCAPGTGTLVKATVNHADGLLTEMPLITCVANMQVIFRLDTNNDGIPDTTAGTTPTLPVLTAMQIKEQVKEVRVYILAHEGPRDNGYQLPAANRTVNLGDTAALGRSVDLLSDVVGDATWANYRWKVYTLFVKPRSFY
jgi:prepilin-type N-terminal cleavage/methylation domain-containing protein